MLLWNGKNPIASQLDGKFENVIHTTHRRHTVLLRDRNSIELKNDFVLKPREKKGVMHQPRIIRSSINAG